jgi:EAL domain-containing protein (putative c-di-GMP-specific phosphodiesterase class I)
MSSEAISLYMSRLIGLILTASDIALEINPAGDVVFAIDGVSDNATLSESVGRSWKSLIHAQDHQMVSDVLSTMNAPGRRGPYLVRRSAEGDAAEQPALFSAVMLAHLAPNISITLSPAPVARPNASVDRAPTLDALEFARRLPALVESHRHKGLGVELAMIELLGFEKACGGRGGEGSGEGSGEPGALLRDITDLLKARSIAGDMVAEITPERFLVLCAKKAHDDLGHALSQVLSEAKIDVVPKTMSVTVPRRLELPYAMRALRLTIEQFSADGISHAGQDLLSSFNGRLEQTFDSAKAFQSMTSSRAFDLVYQPVVSLRSTELHHYEVLSRFPDGSDPFTLIKMAEELEIIVDFDLAVMQKAFGEMRQREHAPNLAINISARSFLQNGFIDRVLRLVAAEPKLKGCLMFEITESAALSDLQLADKYIQHLRSSGYPVCLDDFGSGATSFSYLQALAVDTVKIDGQYIKRLGDGSRDQVLVRHLAMLCKELKINTIAEMVESKATLEALRSCNVDLVQGYYLGRPGPLPAEKRGAPVRRLGMTESWQ